MNKETEKNLISLGTELIIAAPVVDESTTADSYFIGCAVVEGRAYKSAVVVHIDNP